MKKTTKTYAGAGGVVLLASMVLAGTLGSANADTSASRTTGVHLHAHLNPLNNSGTRGNSDVVVHGRRAHVDIDAFGLAATCRTPSTSTSAPRPVTSAPASSTTPTATSASPPARAPRPTARSWRR